ncbi:MAG: S41 family peptidase [Candidatus Cyclobacteriaceae bacterium M3_2C_046]
MMNKFRLIGLSLLVFTGFSFTVLENNNFEVVKNLNLLADVVKEVHNYYVEDIEPERLIKTGIDAMLESLDPYTNYIPEEKVDDFKVLTTGVYSGIGASIGEVNGKNVVLMPIEGYSAFENGLAIGDEIINIDGISIKNKSKSFINNLLKGAENSEVKVLVRKFGMEELTSLTLKREKIKIKNVPYYGKVSDEIGYIKLVEFTADASDEVEDAIIQLKKKGTKKMILDLRDNPGGLLHEAINVSNIFIPKGEQVVVTKGKSSDWNKTYKALSEPVDTLSQLVVITNSKSASAAEIVAGVIQDYDRGVLVGQKTFGKGLVQATRSISDNSKLKLTTAKYYIPSGRCIQSIDYQHPLSHHHSNTYFTENGRQVKDGNGIHPDILLKERSFSPIAQNLIANGLIFEYASYFHFHNNRKIGNDFKLDDEAFDHFSNWLLQQDVDYSTRLESVFREFKKLTDQHQTDLFEQELAGIEDKLNRYKKEEILRQKTELKALLEEEIISREYFTKGKIETSFRYDQELKKALDILENSSQYHILLNKSTKI